MNKLPRALSANVFTVVAALAVAVVVVATPAAAFAQEFEKVEGVAHETIPAVRLVAAAYGFIWAAILIYVLSVARGLARVQREVEELRARLGGGGDGERRGG